MMLKIATSPLGIIPTITSSIILLLLSFLLCISEPANASPLLSGINNKLTYENAISKERPKFEPPADVSGITIPHHLLAADMMARGFWAASTGLYKRVIIISPDHFRRDKKGAIIFNQNIQTVFGNVKIDTPAITKLSAFRKANGDVRFNLSNKIWGETERPGEHGLLALMPFIKKFFPETHIIPIIVGIGTKPEDWSEIADAILPFLDNQTLLIQSTDFSHYLSSGQATLNDQQTLNVISAAEVKQIDKLDQPGHLDSKAAMSIQLDLLIGRLGHHQTIVGNRNSSDYARGTTERTTSYITAVYTRSAQSSNILKYTDQDVFFIGGDVFLGRFLSSALKIPSKVDILIAKVLNATQSSPLIINLEGTLLDNTVIGVPSNRHNMNAPEVIPILKRLNVVAAGLANNHIYDLGELGFQSSVRLLEENGIRPLQHNVLTNLDTINVVAVNHVKGISNDLGAYQAGTPDNKLCTTEARPPILVLAHWGQEYVNKFDKKTTLLAQLYARCGFQVIVGAHSHTAADRIEIVDGVNAIGVFSLGNLIFDQSSEKGATGALMEVRVFQRGAVAARLIPIPNLYDLVR